VVKAQKLGGGRSGQGVLTFGRDPTPCASGGSLADRAYSVRTRAQAPASRAAPACGRATSDARPGALPIAPGLSDPYMGTVMVRRWVVGMVVASACGRVHEPKGLPGGHLEGPDAGALTDGAPLDDAAPASGCGLDAPHEEAGREPDASPCASCTIGAKRCGPRGALQVCTLDETSTCPTWVNDSSCGAGKRCKMKPGDPSTAICCTLICTGKCGGDDGCGGTCPDCGCSATIAEVSSGSRHTCARKQDGTVWCWGGFDGSPVPTPVTGLGGKAAQISSGDDHTCTVLEDGTLWCWGSNAFGKLGVGFGPDQPVPVRVMALGNNVASVSAGTFHTCATLKDGTAWCWGDNEDHELGSGPKEPRPTPGQVPTLANVKQIVAASGATCAVKQDGTLWCWGHTSEGQLGGLGPTQLTSLGSTVVQADVGIEHACAVKLDGTLWCWGARPLGNGATESFSPVQVTALGTGVAAVSTGSGHTCARKSDGTLWCWGDDSQGQVGRGVIPSAPLFLTPVQVDDLDASVTQVSAGGEHSCALRQGGTLWCWGSNQFGQLAVAEVLFRVEPRPIKLGCLPVR
jgi:alpha-tubulin suppressor-like RCC1 family protein